MRARDLAITYPSLTPDAPAEEAARLLADASWTNTPSTRALVGMLGEDVTDALWQRLGGRPVRDLLPAEAAGLAEVDGDDTLLTVAATLARTGASLVVVRDEDGRLLGGITTSRLIRRLLGAP